MKINKPIYKTIMWIIKSITIWLLIALGLIIIIQGLYFVINNIGTNILNYIRSIISIMIIIIFYIFFIVYLIQIAIKNIKNKYEFYKDIYEEYESEENVNE